MLSSFRVHFSQYKYTATVGKPERLGVGMHSSRIVRSDTIWGLYKDAWKHHGGLPRNIVNNHKEDLKQLLHQIGAMPPAKMWDWGIDPILWDKCVERLEKDKV